MSNVTEGSQGGIQIITIDESGNPLPVPQVRVKMTVSLASVNDLNAVPTSDPHVLGRLYLDTVKDQYTLSNG